jgi:hypothetical protein
MSAHVSQLVLDELASGLPAPGGSKEHVELCPECSGRLQATLRTRDASKGSFGWARTMARVTAERPPRWRELLPFIVPVLAAVLFFVVASLDWRPKATERLKGGASVEFVNGGKQVTQAKPGDRLSLEIGAAGHSYALVLAVDKDRHVEVLWEGKLPPGAIVTLPAQVEVTPGPVTVHAFLSNAPLEARVVVPAMENAMTEYGGWPLEAPPPRLPGTTSATQRLYVTP